MAKGTAVRILVGKLRDKRGEVVRVDGRRFVVASAAGMASFLASELVAI